MKYACIYELKKVQICFKNTQIFLFFLQKILLNVNILLCHAYHYILRLVDMMDVYNYAKKYRNME